MTIRERSARQLAAIFGAAFPEKLDTMPVGRWQLAHSRRGLHVLKVVAVHPEEIPALPTVRQRVEDDWRQDRKLEQAANRYREMRANYTIVRTGGSD
jgi:hypothetical protein